MKDFQLKVHHLILLVFAAGVVFIFMSAKKPISDFGNYYYGAKFAAEGRDVSTDVYDVLQFNTNVAVEGETDFFLNHNTVSPQTMLFYLPFAWIGNPALAKLVFGFLSLGFFLFSLNRFLKRFPVSNQWAMGVIFTAALIPIYYNAVFGQSYLLIAALIMESILLSSTRIWLAAFLLSIAIALKISPAILLVFFLSEKKYRLAGLTVFFWFTWTWLTAVLFTSGTQALSVFYFDSLPRMMNGFISDPYSSSSQGFIVFLRKLCSPDAVLQSETLIAGSERMCALINAVFVLIISIILAGAWKREITIRKKVLLLLLFVNFTSGYGSSYSLLLMLPFIELENDTRSWIRTLLYAIVFMFPPRIFDGTSPFLEQYKLWIFIALFFMEALQKFSFKVIERAQVFVAVVFLTMVGFRFAQRPEVMTMSYYKPDVISADFVLGAYVENHKIVCLVPTEKGFDKRSVQMDSTALYSTGPFLTLDERYRHVRFVILASGNDSVFALSDYHRGPGLYHLYHMSKHDFSLFKNPE